MWVVGVGVGGWISRGSIGSVGDQLGWEGICVDGLVGFGVDGLELAEEEEEEKNDILRSRGSCRGRCRGLRR